MKNKIKQGDIYLADLSGYIGSEQNGLRPAVVIQNNAGNFYSPTTVIIPLTSKHKPNLPTHTLLTTEDSSIKKDSTVLCEQMRVVDKSRLKKWLGKINSIEKIKEIRRSLMALVEIGG